jgi:hypothetical protein
MLRGILPILWTVMALRLPVMSMMPGGITRVSTAEILLRLTLTGIGVTGMIARRDYSIVSGKIKGMNFGKQKRTFFP